MDDWIKDAVTFNKLVQFVAHLNVFDFRTGYTSDLLVDTHDVVELKEDESAFLMIREAGTQTIRNESVDHYTGLLNRYAEDPDQFMAKACVFIEKGEGSDFTLKQIQFDQISEYMV